MENVETLVASGFSSDLTATQARLALSSPVNSIQLVLEEESLQGEDLSQGTFDHVLFLLEIFTDPYGFYSSPIGAVELFREPVFKS